MRKIGIIAAMDVEMEAILAAMTEIKESQNGGITFYEGRISGHPAVLAKCGIGKVFAAMCAQTMILCYRPDVIVNSGVAGYLSQGLPVAGVVIASRAVQHDMDTTAIGDPLGLISGINKIYLEADGGVKNALIEAARREDIAWEEGIIATGDCFVSDAMKSTWIREKFGAAAAEMEGGSIAQVCTVNGVPFGIIRAISDNGDEDACEDYTDNLRRAAAACSAVTLSFVREDS